MELGGASVGLRLASSAFQPLIKRLFRQDGVGAGLVDKPVRVSALVSFRGEKRSLSEKDLRKLSEELVRRVVRAIGPHDAPSDDEVLIVSDVLSRSLVRLGELDMDDVQAVRLGHERLAELIGAPIDLFHSPGMYALYRRLLDQCCLHILNFFTQRSTFVARTLREQARQLDAVIARMDLLIERVPQRSVEDAQFEERYADYIQREHSRLTIYGLDLNQEREWPLDDAYLSLEARGRDDAPPQRAERALAGQERVLLRGLAGSGKTTLVQWLAVATARQSIGDGLTHLLGRIPFVLPMRTLTRDGGPLPTPERFLAAVNCPFAAAQPEGWLDRVLSARRGLLLVDGIDEIPEGEREDVRRWVRRLNASYPGNLWLVTARPSAVREDWLGREEFTELTLAPMDGSDVEAFVHRWHRAAGTGPEVESALLDLIRSRSDLGTLATSPLMCAMICALHRERNGYLPRGRKALYDDALRMLLERRDRERPDPPRGSMELDAETQVSLLQKLAYWLINNGRSEMTREVAVSLIGQALPLMHQGGELGSATDKLRHLIERSGVLREPAAGALDFVHRTFQDYLGAREIVEWQHFPALVEKAHEDQWEDVVRMAVAHAQPIQRGELLTALIERGDLQDEHRVRLHLLATACLDHATQLAPEVRAEVVGRAERVIPPRVRSEALTLAHAGSVVLELLPGPETLSDEEAEMVVLAASRIASDAALTKLRAFRDHPSVHVRARLAVSWHRFDTGRYFDEVISRLPREDGICPTATTREELRLLASLDGLSMLGLRGGFTEEDMVTGLRRDLVTHLELRDNGLLGDLSCLRRFRKLTSLVLDSCPGIRDLSPLADTPIRELRLYSDTLWEPQGIDTLTSLRSLVFGTLAMTRSSDVLPWRAPLEEFTAPLDSPGLTEIGAWPGLVRLGLQSIGGRQLARDECEAIAELPHLREIVLGSVTLHNLADSGVRLPRVEWAHLHEVVGRGDLDDLAEVLPGLQELGLTHDPVDLAPLARLPGLRSIEIHEPSELVNVPPHVEVTVEPHPRY
jgi:NACHT conflict system protein/NACHT domain-containing protein